MKGQASLQPEQHGRQCRLLLLLLVLPPLLCQKLMWTSTPICLATTKT